MSLLEQRFPRISTWKRMAIEFSRVVTVWEFGKIYTEKLFEG